MKVVRIQPRATATKKNIRLFDTAEALYVHIKEKTDPAEMEECVTLTLSGDEYMEVEWLGCEFIFEDGKHTRLDSVRLGKALPTENSSGAVVETYVGWISDDDVVFTDMTCGDVEFTRLLKRDECYIDLPFLFGDDMGGEEPSP